MWGAVQLAKDRAGRRNICKQRRQGGRIRGCLQVIESSAELNPLAAAAPPLQLVAVYHCAQDLDVLMCAALPLFSSSQKGSFKLLSQHNRRHSEHFPRGCFWSTGLLALETTQSSSCLLAWVTETGPGPQAC